uniref:Uncharacterized protein n=1 Tax=Avena sativa TaxID=4498 RepID=A0ACD5XMN3_AVESA
MKRQRSSYADDDPDNDRRRFYDRGGPPSPPPPPRRRPAEYESDGFDRRKGFGGRFYDHRYREPSSSPRGYGGDRAMHRSESFSGFRREGFRAERDRPRWDGAGSSAWRRPSGGWRDPHGVDGHKSAARRQAPSPPTPPRRSPSEPRRRLDGAKGEKLRKPNCGVTEMEEGEVAPDPGTNALPAAAEHQKRVHSDRADDKASERCEPRKGLRLGVDLRTQAVDNLGKEKWKVGDDAGKVKITQHEKSALDEADEAPPTAVDQGGQSTSSGMQQEEVVARHDTVNAADVGGQSTSSGILKETTQEEVTTQDDTPFAVDKIAQSTSSSIQQEVPQEGVMPSGEIANDVDVVRKGSSSSMLQEVLPEEGRDGNAKVSDGVGNCSSSSIRQAMQEQVNVVEVTANVVDAMREVSCSGMLKETMHGDMLLTASTINVVGQNNSCGMLEEAIHETVCTQDGTTDALDITGKSSSSTLPQEDVMISLSQEAQEIKEANIGGMTMGGKKTDETTESIASQPVEEGLEKYTCDSRVAYGETEVIQEEAVLEYEIVAEQVKHADTEANLVGTSVSIQPPEGHFTDTKEEGTTLDLITGKPRAEDKGKGIAFDVLNNAGAVSLAETSFDLGLRPPDIDQKDSSKYTRITSVKKEDDTLKLGRLDLSLSLSGGLQNPEFKCFIPRPDPLAHGPCSQSSSSSSSFCTNSDGITASIPLTSSQTLVHNPSFSLTQQSLENCEHSVGSKPLFQGADKVGNSTGWQAQLLSNRSTEKGNTTPLIQRVLPNSHLSDNTLVAANMQNNGISCVLSPAHNHGSHDAGSDHNRHKRQLTRERSSSSLSRGERQHEEQLVLNGAGVVEKVISKIVSEPLSYTGRMFQEMTSNSRAYLREAISDIIVDAGKRGQLVAFQEALKKRSDLSSEILQRCPRVLLEILVAIRTGLPDVIKRSASIATSDLVDIFLNLKCRNLSCQSVLPVFDCDCKICQQKTGFCSNCMCIVCLKFDLASNTCSWVGCDVCLHWCHTDCGLRHSLIRKGGSSSRAHGTNEMHFHCAACGHASEMYGFVKEVFRTCAKQWRMEALIRELQFVERIFSASEDARGRRIRNFVKQMLIKLQNKAYYSEVVKYVIAFFSDDNPSPGMGSGPLVPLKGIPCSIAEGINGIPSSSRTATWSPSVTLEGVPFLEKAGLLSTTGSKSISRKMAETELQAVNNKPVPDELDGLVRLKQAEANMYQERANEARKEAESLKHVAMVKYARIEEHYATQISELRINELQERRKQMLEELQVVERSRHQFLSMKTRMEDSIRELLLKMEAAKQNLRT